MKMIFEGTGVALVTPFSGGQVDYAALKKLIVANIENGASAIIVLGTTGEGSTILEEERLNIIKQAKEAICGRAKLIVGTGSNDFAKALYNTHMAKKLGADGVLVVTPYYNKTFQSGIVEYYNKLSQIGIPLIMYNVPSRTGLNIELETISKLIDNDMIYGIKESSKDISRIIKLAGICKDKIALYSGEDELNYIFYCLGAKGCISVTANICTKQVDRVFTNVKYGNYKQALKLQEELTGINELLFIETNPIPIKAVMARMGLIENELRMPLAPLEERNKSKVEEYINSISF